MGFQKKESKLWKRKKEMKDLDLDDLRSGLLPVFYLAYKLIKSCLTLTQLSNGFLVNLE